MTNVITHAGEVVAAGTPILTMIDMKKLYVRVFLDERDVGRIRRGEDADVTVDAYPGRVFKGTVSEIDQNAQFTPKTVHMPDERTRLVYGVKIALRDTQGIMNPGMIADAQLKGR